MGFYRLLLLVAVLAAGLSGPAFGDTVETRYQKARGNYTGLQKSTRNKLYRENWIQVIDDLLGVTDAFPGHSRAPDALYLAGKACGELYEVSRAPRDAMRAVDLFDRLAEEFPRDSLSDDALIRSGEILEVSLKDPAKAYLRFARAAERGGDMVSLAENKMRELAAHAPAKPPAPSPAIPGAARGEGNGAQLTALRFWSNPGYTRVVLNLSAAADFSAHLLPGDPKKGISPRIYVDVTGVPGTDLQETTEVKDGLLQRIRTGRYSADRVRIVLDLVSLQDYKVFPLQGPDRIIIDVAGDRSAALSDLKPQLHSPPGASPDAIAKVLESVPAERPLKMQIPSASAGHGLRRIVVDAGHGGKDPGAIGPTGVMEKDVTLAMARVLARKLEKDLGCEVILTRGDDVYLSLEERTAIANKVGADLFISLHANATRGGDAFGVETYYLNFSKNDKAAAVAARENGTSLKEVGDLELILFDLMANAKINESSRLAAEIQKALVSGLGTHYSQIKDLGVRQGPFYVLVGATMPSVLVETAFISNKREEARLKDRKFHEKTSDAIARGVRHYATALKLIASQ